MSACRPMVAARREQHLDVEERSARAESLADEAEEVAVRRERLPRLRLRVVAEQQVGVARRRQRGEELHLRGVGAGREDRDRRPQAESCPGREQRKQRGERVEGGQLEDEAVEMPAEVERERRERSHAAEHRDLHAALAACFVAGAEDGALGGLHRLEKTQRLLLSRERPLAQRQRRGAQLLERVERLEVIAVTLAHVLDEGELAAPAIAGALRSHAVPAIEAFEQDRLARQRGTSRQRTGGLAPFERRGTSDRGGGNGEHP